MSHCRDSHTTMSRDWCAVFDDTDISRQRSEIIDPLAASKDPHFRQMTFDELFQQKFVPLDSKKKVGSYLLGRVIGEGSFSKVRLGKQIDTGEKMAVKIIPKKTMLKRQDTQKRFIQETKTLRSLNHKHIVRLLEVMETNSNYYLVMALLRGENFKDYLHKRPVLAEDEARAFMQQLADAVQYMHSQNIVHRDLKPENCMVADGSITIFDFGLSACLAERGGSMTTQCGSPAYAAPEIFNQQPYNKLVDTWSIGVILFLVVTGCLPYACKGKSYAHLYTVILQGYTIPASTSISKECDDLISKLLQVDAGKRLSAEQLLQHQWFKPACDKTKHDKENGNTSAGDTEKCDKGACDKGNCDKGICDKGNCDKGNCDKGTCDKGICDTVRFNSGRRESDKLNGNTLLSYVAGNNCEQLTGDSTDRTKLHCDKAFCDKSHFDKPRRDKPTSATSSCACKRDNNNVDCDNADLDILNSGEPDDSISHHRLTRCHNTGAANRNDAKLRRENTDSRTTDRAKSVTQRTGNS